MSFIFGLRLASPLLSFPQGLQLISNWHPSLEMANLGVADFFYKRGLVGGLVETIFELVKLMLVIPPWWLKADQASMARQNDCLDKNLLLVIQRDEYTYPNPCAQFCVSLTQ